MVLYTAVFLGFMAVMSLTDLRSRRLPNVLVAGGAAVWAVLQIAGFGPEWGDGLAPGWVNGLVTGLLVGLIFAAIFVFFPQAMGGGDVKLAAVMGLYLGWPLILSAFFIGFLAAAVVGLGGMLLGRMSRGDTLPLAPFLAVGAVWAVLVGSSIGL